MTKLLPLFPLQMVVFPGEELRLHIFEPRYRELMHDCKEEQIAFGIPAYIDSQMMELATTVRLLRTDRLYDSGEQDVTVLGIGLRRINQFHPVLSNKQYAGADTEPVLYSTREDIGLNEQILYRVRELFRLLSIRRELPARSKDFLTYDLAHHVGFSLAQEYAFLRITHARDRQHFLLDHLNQMLPEVRKMENLRLKAMMNGAHHNVIPPRV